ncbi:glycosyltransferase family 4 protein [Kaistella sp. 97-N-M2]|uniref:glycosyltransferase family 4 protein n=1 Tax=Kaistella sp. 97-N-M2 TaxID=2908645 RepID=UPI001F305AB0|nr:glycosyltransferase family 4 protein [Kaistella sp. 97-N-M2]UJF29138.1 glycosyltransferase family 4 protein [Kaistella sp. 97-N-M2]
MFQTAADYKVNQHPVVMKREISIIYDILSLVKLIAYFLKEKPNMVHGNTPKGSFLSMTAAWLCRVPSRVYYVHGLRYQGTLGFKRKLLMTMERICCYFATDIIAVSKGVKRTLIKDAISNKKVKIIWNGSINGIDLKHFSPKNPELKDIRNEYNISENDFVFGFVGRLVGDKGVNEMVHSFDKINALHKNTRLLLIGNFENELDPLREDTLEIIANNEMILEAGVQDDVRSYLKAMDLFVFPSYREGFGIVLMEAAAMSIPAISSDITGCNEIIQNNRTGFLIPPKDENALFEKMKYCIENPEEIKIMAALARKTMRSKYEQNQVWEKVIEKYREIIL